MKIKLPGKGKTPPRPEMMEDPVAPAAPADDASPPEPEPTPEEIFDDIFRPGE